MNGNSMHWVNRLAALGLVVGLVAGLAAAGNAQSVGGQAYSTYVNTPLGYSGQSPLAVVAGGSGHARAPARAERRWANLGGGPAARVPHNLSRRGKHETGARGRGRARPPAGGAPA